MLLWLVAAIVVVIVAAAVHDVVARRKGTYRDASHWREMGARRRAVKRPGRRDEATPATRSASQSHRPERGAHDPGRR